MKNHAYFQMSKHIYYGCGSFKVLGEIVKKKGKRVLIINDKIISELGYVNECVKSFNNKNIETEIYLDIKSKPTDKYVEESLSLLKKV